jgi:putative inorganic carbon (HCO3(-)) transporter
LPTYAYKNVFISSGVTGHPVFFGGFLTLAGGVTIILSIFSKGNRRFVCTLISLALFTVGLFTSSITPIIGFSAVSLCGVILSLAVFKTDRSPFKTMMFILAGFVLIFFIVLSAQGLWIRDVYIARLDALNNKGIVGAHTLADTRSLYAAAWGDSVEYIKESPILGVGPDAFAAKSGFASMKYDKSYNEFLYVASTRGLPSLIAYCVLLVFSFVRVCKSMKTSFGKPEFMYYAVIFTSCASYVIQSFVNASAVTVAPIFWLLLGLSFVVFPEPKTKKIKRKKKASV